MAKYGKKAQASVKSAAHKAKHGKLKSGKSGKTVKSRKQAIAIGLSKARRAGLPLPPPPLGTNAAKARAGSRATARPSRRRSEATERALKREPRGTTSSAALSAHARRAGRRRDSQ